MNRIRISNDCLWAMTQHGQDIDQWLVDNVGFGLWTEYIGVTALPYRSFSFKDPRHEMLFVLTWLR